MIFLIRIKCKICFNCKRKKIGKTIVGKSAIRGGGGSNALQEKSCFFLDFWNPSHEEYLQTFHVEESLDF